MRLKIAFPIFFLVLMCLPQTGKSQEPLRSQYFNMPIFMNPAMIGYQSGLTFRTLGRKQWPNIGTFDQLGFSVEQGVSCFNGAFGLAYHMHRAGPRIPWLVNQEVSLAYSYYTIHPGDEPRFFMQFGLAGTYTWSGFDPRGLVFTDQLDEVYGNINPSSITLDLDEIDNNRYVDFNTGLAGTLMLNDFKDRLTLGAAIHHLRISRSPVASEDTLPFRTVIHGTLTSLRHYNNQKRKYYLVPMFKLDFQRAWPIQNAYMFRNISTGVGFYDQQKPWIWGGLWIRHRGYGKALHTNSIVWALGMEFLSNGSRRDRANHILSVGLGGDIDYSGLRSRGGGSFEATISWNFPGVAIIGCRKGGKKRPNLPCPKFN